MPDNGQERLPSWGSGVRSKSFPHFFPWLRGGSTVIPLLVARLCEYNNLHLSQHVAWRRGAWDYGSSRVKYTASGLTEEPLRKPRP